MAAGVAHAMRRRLGALILKVAAGAGGGCGGQFVAQTVCALYCSSHTNRFWVGRNSTTWSQHRSPSLRGKNEVRWVLAGPAGFGPNRLMSVKVWPPSVETLMPVL